MLTRAVLSSFAILLCAAAPAGADADKEPALIPDGGERALKQAVLDLGRPLRMLSLAAHPDDEDGATLAYYRMRYGVRTYTVIATRGEGGQNEIGPELYEDLAVIRTRETERAGAILGARVYSLNLRDFGFSKSAAEALKVWGHKEALGRLVYLIRLLKPDVLITNHDTVSGHGHHRACGILIREAFDQAAEAKAYPEHLQKGLKPWDVTKLYLRRFPPGRGKEPEDYGVRVDTDAFNALRGMRYTEIAGEALKRHRSQGMGQFGWRLRGPRFFKRLKSRVKIEGKENELIDGLGRFDELVARAGLGDELIQSAVAAQASMDSALEMIQINRRRVFREIAAALTQVRQMQKKLAKDKADRRERAVLAENIKRQAKRLNDAAVQALGVQFRLTSSDALVCPGQTYSVSAEIINPGPFTVTDFTIRSREGLPLTLRHRNKSLLPGKAAQYTWWLICPADSPLTLPKRVTQYRSFATTPVFQRYLGFKVEGVALEIVRPVPVEITAPHEISVSPARVILRTGQKPRTLVLRAVITNRLPGRSSGTLTVAAPRGWRIDPGNARFAIAREDRQQTVTIRARLPALTSEADFAIVLRAKSDRYAATTTAQVRVVAVKAAPGLKVGLVETYDGTYARALDNLGVSYRKLSPEDIKAGDLSGFHTILLGIRAYLYRPELRAANDRLLEYVRGGGHLVVSYNKLVEWNDGRDGPFDLGANARWAPYPITLTRARVTVEDAPVTVLKPLHPLFGWPNRIAAADWDGWFQERGLYFPTSYDKAYTELLACNDPGEKPLRGGHLIANYGKGTYLYTAYVWYRQLQRGHPGTTRIFANMISLPMAKTKAAVWPRLTQEEPAGNIE